MIPQKTIRLFLLSVFLFVGCLTHSAQAQFWKKKEKKNTSKNIIKEHTEEDIPELIDSTQIEIEDKAPKRQIPTVKKSTKKDEYQIDVVLPLGIEEISNQKVTNPDKLSNAKKNLIYYIEGMQIAIDTLNKMKVPINLYVHDAIRLNEKIINNSLFSNQLANSDALIAHTSSQELSELSQLSAANEIMLFSTFSPGGIDIKEQPYFYILNPKLNSHIESLLAFGQKKFVQDPKFFIYDTTSALSLDTYHKFNDFMGGNAISAFNWKHDKSQESIMENLVLNRKNVFYSNTMSPSLILEFLDFLETIPEDYEIVVMGMPNWKSYIQKKELAPIHFYTTQAFYFDGQGGLCDWLKEQYKERHGREIHDMVYRGFELIFGLGNALEKNGNQLHDPLSKSHRLWPLSHFNMEAQFDDNDSFLYFENNYLYIMHHYNGNEQVVH